MEKVKRGIFTQSIEVNGKATCQTISFEFVGDISTCSSDCSTNEGESILLQIKLDDFKVIDIEDMEGIIILKPCGTYSYIEDKNISDEDLFMDCLSGLNCARDCGKPEQVCEFIKAQPIEEELCS